MKDRMYQVTVYLIATLALVFNLTACGKAPLTTNQINQANCVSEWVDFAGGFTVWGNGAGVFADGFQTTGEKNSCGQIMNGTMSANGVTIDVVDGKPSAAK